jgi:tetratricopeptide (TPR) repeat protein
MATIVISFLNTDIKSEIEEYCKNNSHQFISVELNKFIESLGGKIPDIYILEIKEINYDTERNIEKIKKEPTLKNMTIMTYLDEMDVGTEVSLRKLKIDTFILSNKKNEMGAMNLFKSLDKYFEHKEIKNAMTGEKEKSFDNKMISELAKRKNGGIDVNTLANEFDSMVSNEVGDGDFDTHYNLGQSYLEMGLYDNAIKSLSLSAKSPEMYLASCQMIGVCYYRQGQKNKAVSTLFAGFKSSKGKKEGAGIGFELGNILYEFDRKKDALNIFKMVEKVDPDFMDIKDKVAKLEKELGQ